MSCSKILEGGLGMIFEERFRMPITCTPCGYFPQAEHDDLFDGLQTMMEGVIQFASYSGGCSVAGKSLFPADYFDDFW